MSTIEERAPIHPTTDQLLDDLHQTLIRAEALWTDLAAILTGPVTVDLGVPADRPVWTVPVSEVPVDGSVELRTCPPAAGGRFGPWAHVVGESLRAVGGESYRSLLVGGLTEPWTFHLDQCVQLRRARVRDELVEDARHRVGNGGL